MTTPHTASTTDARKRLAENTAGCPRDHAGPCFDGRPDLCANILTDEKAAATEAKIEALRDAANDLRTNAGRAWGGDHRWLTNGTHVANLAAGWLDGMADDLAAIGARP